jgi:hypothetical protein
LESRAAAKAPIEGARATGDCNESDDKGCVPGDANKFHEIARDVGRSTIREEHETDTKVENEETDPDLADARSQE